MPIFFVKSLLSLPLLLLTLFAMFTMFELLGRVEKKYDVEKFKKLHRINGKIYFLLYLLIAYFCLDFIIDTKAETSTRATFHSVFALTIFILICLKVIFIRIYRQFYGQVKIIGLLIALITFLMMGTSTGYYLLITKFGTDTPVKKAEKLKAEEKIFVVKTDPESILKGKELFDSKCYFCHDHQSEKWGVGPGHKGILKNPFLPVSKKPTTYENIVNQIRNPHKDMPSFSYLTDDEISSLIAYMNTL